MRIAILGGTSLIARDFIESMAKTKGFVVDIYSRRTDQISMWLITKGITQRFSSKSYYDFTSHLQYDLVMNFVGIGSPITAKKIGKSILDTTLEFDDLALGYIKKNKKCRYIFLSSGAAYGQNFKNPVTQLSQSNWTINHLETHDFYGIAKMHAECRHRALDELSIVDLRIFNYFSHSQSVDDGFFVTDALRAVKNNEVFKTSRENIIRDFIGPTDFAALLWAILDATFINDVFDCYTKAPIDKHTLLKELTKQFNLKVEINDAFVNTNATGIKQSYYSENKKAEHYGYYPQLNSLETVIYESKKMLKIE